METYLFYIGKSALGAGAFYLAFVLLFQNQKHFTFNRIYLPVSLGLSFLIPLITFTTVKYIEPVSASGFNGFAYLPESTAKIEEPQFILEWYHYLFGLYILGSSGFLFHLFLGHLKAIHIIKKSRILQLFESSVNITQKDVHPFSFFSKIVLSEKTLSHPNLKMIIEHENIHVKEKHTLDILFAEILFLLQWFNPFAWLLKDAMKNNLEYITDHEIAKTNHPQTYQLAMVSLADKKGVAPFLNALNGSQLKNRIIMMKKKTENKYAFVKQLVVLPLLAVLVMGLSNKEVKTEIIQQSNVVYSTQNKEYYENILNKNPETDVANNNNGTDANFNNSIGEKNLKSSTDTIQKTVGKAEKHKKDFIENSNIPVEEIVTFRLLKDSSVIFQYGDKNENGETIIKTITRQNATTDDRQKDTLASVNENSVYFKAEEMPEFPGGESALKKYIQENIKYPPIALERGIWGKVYVSIIISNEGEVTNPMIVKGIDPYLNKEALRVIKSLPDWKPGKKNGMPVNVHYTVPVEFNIKGLPHKIKSAAEGLSVPKPLFIVNGIETANIEAIDPENIKSIDVIKDKSATDIYGEKGVNGVILITTKNPVKFNPGISGNPVVIVDGQRYDSVEDVNVQPDEIASISVLKNESATKLYGEQAKDGAIIINTKTKYNSEKTDPLIIVNGKETGQNIKDIDPETIESMNVLKDESATVKYGEKGKNDVIEITLKPEKIDTELKLRKFIAKEIKYPLEAVETNTDGEVSFLFRVDKNGNIFDIMKAKKKDINLETVVVTAYKTKTPGKFIKNQEWNLLTKEVKRVIEKVPVIQIPEFSEKTVQVNVKFVLQD